MVGINAEPKTCDLILQVIDKVLDVPEQGVISEETAVNLKLEWLTKYGEKPEILEQGPEQES